MKLIHLSDLHIGKRVNEFPMLEDQKYILKEILNIIEDGKPDGVIIAGDVYDKSVPSAEAVEVFDDFLVSLAGMNQQVFVISGNHDSPERLAFGNRLMDVSGVHISSAYKGNAAPYELSDKAGKVNIYMLPFVKPAIVRTFAAEDDVIESYTDAIRAAIKKMDVDMDARNVLVAHQFVTGAERSESEDVSVGGLDNVDASAFAGFDYVALGHIHGPQNIEDNIRYSGTPLKYSFSEAGHRKSVTVVELGSKGSLKIREVPLTPLRDMVEIRGTYDELMNKSFYDGTTYNEDYMHITLTDEDDIPEAMNRMRVVYKNIMKLDYDNKRTRHRGNLTNAADVDNKSPLELTGDFFRERNGVDMSDDQLNLVRGLIEKIWEDRK